MARELPQNAEAIDFEILRHTLLSLKDATDTLPEEERLFYRHCIDSVVQARAQAEAEAPYIVLC